jgi:hypothetical protein
VPMILVNGKNGNRTKVVLVRLNINPSLTLKKRFL